jgi:hypothetical protein
MKSMWTQFGFSKTPYRTTPLEASAEDFELFTGRVGGESAEILTAMDTTDGSVVVVSGDVGIGKTSFVNIQQHLLATEAAIWGPELIPCIQMTPLTMEDSITTLARRIVEDAVLNIEAYCSQHKKRVPTECKTVRDWLSHRPTKVGFQLTLGLAGAGYQVSLPPVGDATLATWRNILHAIAIEVREILKVDGFTVCLDNAETLTYVELVRLLMSYRDTLFVIKGVWWIIIGPSELYKQIDALDRRVSQRISGSGVELSHLSIDEFHDLINRRVKVYRKRDDAVSPLSKNLHDLLFQAACGEVRFVLDTADKLVQKIVKNVRTDAMQRMPAKAASHEVLERVMTEALKAKLIDNQIPDELALRILKEMVQEAMSALRKTPDGAARLQTIGNGSITKNDHARFGFASPDEFLATFLETLRLQGLLGRQAGATMHSYRLKGFAWLANDFGMLS